MQYKINIFVKVLLQRLFTASKRTSYCCGIAKNVITIEKTYALVCKELPPRSFARQELILKQPFLIKEHRNAGNSRQIDYYYYYYYHIPLCLLLLKCAFFKLVLPRTL